MNTLQVQGMLKKQTVLMLVDSGSTSNFIDLHFAKRIGLQLAPLHAVSVSVADGFSFPIQCMCKQLTWSMQGVTFCSDFYVIPIGGYGMVLGIQWLATLGDIKCNFSKLCMEFVYGGEMVHLQGATGMSASKPKSQQLFAAWKEEQAYVMQSLDSCSKLWSIVLDDALSKSLSPPQLCELQKLLNSYEDEFATPTILPPKRVLDHGITLEKGSNPVNLRAYKYGAQQKDAIEELVQESGDA